MQESGEVARLRPPGSPCRLGPALAPAAAAGRSTGGAGGAAVAGGPCPEDGPRLERRSASLERLSRSLSQERGEGAGPAMQARPTRESHHGAVPLCWCHDIALQAPMHMWHGLMHPITGGHRVCCMPLCILSSCATGAARCMACVEQPCCIPEKAVRAAGGSARRGTVLTKHPSVRFKGSCRELIRKLGAQACSECDLEEQTLRLLSGRRVLLVEPCEMVRSVLALDMRAWGCAVCAVASEQAAIARLRLRGGPKPGAHSRGEIHICMN